MRTTLTIDDKLDARLRRHARSRKMNYKDAWKRQVVITSLVQLILTTPGTTYPALPVGVASVVVLGFVRILSSPTVVARPALPEELLAVAGRWLERPVAQQVEAAADFTSVMRHHFARTGASARLTTDPYLAAVAMSHGAVLHSNDSDFNRIEGLSVGNPLEHS